MTRVASATALVLGLALVACAAKPVVLSETWPEKPGSYRDVHRQWTRRGRIQDYFAEALVVYATFKSPAWRAAYVRHTARKKRLPDELRQSLESEHREKAAGPYEVELLVTTHAHGENDLHKGKRSVWRVALVDAKGRQVEPIAIKRDRRPVDVIRAEYPDMGDFAVAYVALFPRTIDIFADGAERFSLIIASARGSTELVWKAR